MATARGEGGVSPQRGDTGDTRGRSGGREGGFDGSHLEVLLLQDLLPPAYQEGGAHVQVEVGEALGLGLDGGERGEHTSPLRE